MTIAQVREVALKSHQRTKMKIFVGGIDDDFVNALNEQIAALTSPRPMLTVEQILSRCANRFVMSRDAMRTLKHILPYIVRMSREGQEAATPTLTPERTEAQWRELADAYKDYSPENATNDSVTKEADNGK